jgi:hypothetical protein
MGTKPNDRKKALYAAQLLMLGETHLGTAAIVGISQATLTNWKSGPEWAAIQAEARSMPSYEALAFRARARLGKLVDSRDEKIALKATLFVMEHTDFLPSNLAHAANEAEAKRDGTKDLDDMTDEELAKAAGVELDFGVPSPVEADNG